MRSRGTRRCSEIALAPSWDIAITRSARRATGGTTVRHRRIVAPTSGSGATIQVTSASETTLTARVRSGAVSARLKSVSTPRRVAIGPRIVSSDAARSPRRPSSGWVTSSASLAQASRASSSRPPRLTKTLKRTPGARRMSSGTSARVWVSNPPMRGCRKTALMPTWRKLQDIAARLYAG